MLLLNLIIFHPHILNDTICLMCTRVLLFNIYFVLVIIHLHKCKENVSEIVQCNVRQRCSAFVDNASTVSSVIVSIASTVSICCKHSKDCYLSHIVKLCLLLYSVCIEKLKKKTFTSIQ